MRVWPSLRGLTAPLDLVPVALRSLAVSTLPTVVNRWTCRRLKLRTRMDWQTLPSSRGWATPCCKLVTLFSSRSFGDQAICTRRTKGRRVKTNASTCASSALSIRVSKQVSENLSLAQFYTLVSTQFLLACSSPIPSTPSHIDIPPIPNQHQQPNDFLPHRFSQMRLLKRLLMRENDA